MNCVFHSCHVEETGWGWGKNDPCGPEMRLHWDVRTRADLGKWVWLVSLKLEDQFFFF